MTIDLPDHIQLDTINAILALDRGAIVKLPDGSHEYRDIPKFLLKEPQ